MNLEDLLARVAASEKLNLLVDTLRKPSGRAYLTGVAGGLEVFVISSLLTKLSHDFLVIAADREEAAYLQNDLQSILENTDVLFLPDSFRRIAHYEELNRNHVLQRTEVVNKLLNTSPNGGLVLVTYPEALFEKIVAPEHLRKAALEVAKDAQLDLDFLIDTLIEYGFERTDFVYEPGQFAVRSAIIDIYSYGNELPYRIELFDDQVESIRIFDPVTQLSDRNLAKVSFIPNINTQFNSAQKKSLLDLLQENTIVWSHNLDFCFDRLTEAYDRTAEYQDKIPQLKEDGREEEAQFLEEKSFLSPREVMDNLLSFPVVELGAKSYFKNPQNIAFDSKPQPSFNKNFKLLIQDLTERQSANEDIFIFAENPTQIERFRTIFNDLKTGFAWTAIQKGLHNGFISEELRLVCYTDHQFLDRYHKFKVKGGFEKDAQLTLRRIKELKVGDYVTHLDHGIGKYSGLEKISVGGQMQEAVRLIYRDSDVLYVSINSLHKISKYVGKDGDPPKIHKLGTDAWAATKRKAKSKIKELAIDLIGLYARRKATKGYAFAPDNYLQTELEASFIYEDTPDQAKATEDVKRDLQADFPMDRLICGDVGFGKTEIAVRAAFKTVLEGKQVAILVPTTILALQHARTFNERFKDFSLKVAYINRFCTAKEKTEIYKKVENKEIDVLIGTHALLNQKVKFKDLGLLVIDEEQKFGVGAKEKIREMKINVDTLTLTATPIPRTLQFSLLGARDLSVINTAPPNRQPIQTEIKVFNDLTIKESIAYEIGRGGQVFFIHNRVTQLPDVAAMVRKLCPEADIAVAHGQMESDKLEEVLLDFIEGKHDVLVCTNIIETGLDIPNANTIIINNAQNFGLSDLHQLRGRVGRSNRKAFCYLFCPPLSTLTDEARKRLRTIEEFSDLGSGFNIAMRDLDIRGAGNMLGGEQSGFIMDIGYETYQKILDEAIRELKETDFRDLYREEMENKHEYVREINIETDIEMLIPDEYVLSIQERLSLYTELDNIETEEQLQSFIYRLQDRFGKVPRQVNELFEGLRLRWICRYLGFERIILKGQKLRCYFITNAQSSYYETPFFKKVMAAIAANSDYRFFLKQSDKALILNVENIRTLSAARKTLEELKAKIV